MAAQSVLKTGMKLPTLCGITQNTADAGVMRGQAFSTVRIRGNVKHVVAAYPQWAETHSLIRYPSPERRSCIILCRPPLFSDISMVFFFGGVVPILRRCSFAALTARAECR